MLDARRRQHDARRARVGDEGSAGFRAAAEAGAVVANHAEVVSLRVAGAAVAGADVKEQASEAAP